jgi:(p)ppGpp synthase/HD superfamily hydrolase
MPSKAEHQKYLYNTAKAIAKLYHFGQFDRAGEKAIAHVRAVVHNVLEMTLGMDSDFITKCACVAWLHDTAEDGPTVVVTPDDEDYPYTALTAIELLFGRGIRDTVEILTHNKYENDSYERYIRYIEASGNKVAVYVKLADLKNNMNRDRAHAAFEYAKTPEDKEKCIKRQERYAEAVKILTAVKDKLNGKI